MCYLIESSFVPIMNELVFSLLSTVAVYFTEFQKCFKEEPAFVLYLER